jgi:hypothetical protein
MQPHRRSGWIGSYGALAAAGVLGALLPAAAGEFTPPGKGPGSDHPGLPGSAGCANCSHARPPHEWDAPFFEIDWSLSLRGAYVHDGEGGHFEALAVPRLDLRHETMRGGYGLEAEAELSKSSIEAYRLTALRLRVEGDHALDEVTALSGSLQLELTQDSPGPPGQPGGVAVAPVVLSGATEVGADRRLGRFVLGVRGDAGRTVYGPATLTGGGESDNSAQNNWTAGGGLRLGYEVTPLLTAFVDGSVGYQRYDEVSPNWLVALDAADYELRAGLAADWHQVVEAEASVGLGLRRFAEPTLGEILTTLYDASLTFRPDETVTLSAALSTSVGAPGPDLGGTARVAYEVTGSASYQVNPWLRLRASAGWEQVRFAGIDGTESGYSLGSGLDYRVNEHTTVTADYDFSRSATETGSPEDEQQVTLGVALSR